MSGGVNIVSALDHFWNIQIQTFRSMYNDLVWLEHGDVCPEFLDCFCLHRRTSRNVLGDGTNEEGESVAPLTMKLDEVEDIVLWLGSHLQQQQQEKTTKTMMKLKMKVEVLWFLRCNLSPNRMSELVPLTWSNLHLQISEVSTGILPTLCEAEDTLWPFFCPGWLQTNGCEVCWKSCMMPMIFVASGFKPSIAVWHD